MAEKNHVLGLSALSAAIGLALLVCASLIIDEFRPALNTCETFFGGGAACDPLRFWIAAGSIGIIAGLIQIGSFILGHLDKTKLWSGVHVLLCVLCITCFAIAVDKNGFHENSTSKAKAFTSFALIDMVFTFLAAIGMFKFLGAN